MTKSDKVNYVINELEKLYPSPPIPLKHKDHYTLLVAVLLSAQCTDERVNKITPLLYAKADNPFDMIKLSIEEIKAINKEEARIAQELKDKKLNNPKFVDKAPKEVIDEVKAKQADALNKLNSLKSNLSNFQ